MHLQQSRPYQVRTNLDHAAVHVTPPPLTPLQQQTRALAIARALEPKKAMGYEQVRLGRERDGGYVLVNDFSNVSPALSFGIADAASWHLEIAGKSSPVH